MTPFRSMKKGILSKDVASQIRKAIANNVFKPGERLPPERNLVNQFQVSRVTVREALKELEKDGLVLIKRGPEGGACVCELSPEPIINSFRNLISLGKINIPHLLHARICIEPQLARAAAIIRTNEDIDRLRALIEEAERHVSSSLAKALLMNLNFHSEICKISDNPILSFIAESVNYNWAALIHEITRGKVNKDEIIDTIAEHKDILDLIIEKNTNDVYEKTLHHLLKNHEKLMRMIPELKIEKVDQYIRSLGGAMEKKGREYSE